MVIAEARSVHEEIASKISEVVMRADVSALGMADNITGKIREVAVYTDAQTSRTVGNLQSKTREFVEGHCRNLETKIDHNQVEARRAAQETKAAIDQLLMQLVQLTTQLVEHQLARSADVVTGQHQLSQDVSARL